jgi:hypothetical protein
MKKILFIISIAFSTFLNAQNYVHQTLILNEGYFDYLTDSILVPVTIGSYNPTTNNYQTVATLNDMRFASDLIINGNYYYVAADTKIFKMDLNTHQEVLSVSCPGVINLEIYQNKLIATRGEYLADYNSYLHIYDASNLSLIVAIDTVQGPKYASQNIVIDGSSAYIAVNNGFEWGNEKGFIGKLDLNTLTYGNEVDLGPDGKNPDNLVKSGAFLYTVNNKDFSGSSVSKIALDGSLNSTVNIASAATGCGTSALRDDKLVYQISQENSLNEFDIISMSAVGPVNGHNLSYYELVQESVSGNLYASETDYFSFGKVHIFDANNNELSNFNVGISPGTIVFDVRPSVGLSEIDKQISIYPNPSDDYLNFPEFSDGEIKVLDMTGKVLLYAYDKTINVSKLQKGYFVIDYKNIKYRFLKN